MWFSKIRNFSRITEVPECGLSSLLLLFDQIAGLSCDLLESDEKAGVEGGSSDVANSKSSRPWPSLAPALL